jgi:Mg2+ and Co2+ transporter CorA
MEAGKVGGQQRTRLNTMNLTEKNIDRVATALAAAYWRGRFEMLKARDDDPRVIEAAISAAADSEKGAWHACARNMLNLLDLS